MNQIARHDRSFTSFQRIVPFPPTPPHPVRPTAAVRKEFVRDQLNWPGWLRWLATGWKLYQGVRRTRIAFDSLSHEQLKDIGYRRVSEGSYDQLP